MIREVQTQSVALTADEWQALEQKRRNMTDEQLLQLDRWKAAWRQMNCSGFHPATQRATEAKMRSLVSELKSVRDWNPSQIKNPSAASTVYREELPPEPRRMSFDYSVDKFNVLRSLMG